MIFLQFVEFFSLSATGGFILYTAYNYTEPSIYTLQWKSLNPSQGYGIYLNPSVMAGGEEFKIGFYLKSKNLNQAEILFKNTDFFDLLIPFVFRSEEKGGIRGFYVFKKIKKFWTGISFLDSDVLNIELKGGISSQFYLDLYEDYTITKKEIPALREEDTIPVSFKVYGNASFNASLSGLLCTKSFPFYFAVGWESKKIKYGIDFLWTIYEEDTQIKDSISYGFSPTGVDILSSSEWNLGVDASVEFETPSFFSFTGKREVRGYEPGIGIGLSGELFQTLFGASIIHRPGARIIENISTQVFKELSMEIKGIEGSKVVVDTLNKTLSGKMHIKIGSKNPEKMKDEKINSLLLPPRTTFSFGMHASPFPWEIDMVLFFTRTWGISKTSEIFIGTGFGIQKPFPLRLSQVLFYRIIYIEDLPIFTLPAVFYGVSTTIKYKHMEVDLGMGLNTTTSIFYSLGGSGNIFSRYTINLGVSYGF